MFVFIWISNTISQAIIWFDSLTNSNNKGHLTSASEMDVLYSFYLHRVVRWCRGMFCNSCQYYSNFSQKWSSIRVVIVHIVQNSSDNVSSLECPVQICVTVLYWKLTVSTIGDIQLKQMCIWLNYVWKFIKY